MSVLFFIYGLFIGSFLNVCIYRIPAGQSVISPPSACGSCGHRLSYFDMLPVVNYVYYKGRCRYCTAHYSVQYPVTELSNGIIYCLMAVKYGFSVYAVFYCMLASLLIVASTIDIKHMIIPDSVNIVGAIIGAMLLIYERETVLDKIFGLLTGFILFAMIAAFTGSMGGGDVKLMAVTGFIFGIKGVLFITLVSFIIGAFVSLILICLNLISRKSRIPFGPFISSAVLLYIFYGSELMAAYFNLFYGRF
ncbi:MAG TPA: prepilin peptidase [Clostridiales bacterium]|nr:prepilin peptidase [Clostridiales bacterium]